MEGFEMEVLRRLPLAQSVLAMFSYVLDEPFLDGIFEEHRGRCYEDVLTFATLATCADMLGAKLPDNAGEDSVSILPALLGTATGPIREAVVHHSIKGNFAIRQGQWKLDFCPDSGGWSKGGVADTPGQLYDMNKDVGERANEYKQYPEIVSRLTKLLEKYVADGRSTPGPPGKNDVKVDIWKKNAPKGELTE
jgi:hypothetical protein